MVAVPPHLTEPLPAMDVAGRLDRLRAGWAGDGTGGQSEPAVDGLLVTSMTNIRYLSGFTGSAGVLIVGSGGATLITDGRYGEQSAEQLRAAGVEADIEVVTGGKQAGAARAAADRHGIARLGLEAAHVTWAQQRAWARDGFAGLELLPTLRRVEALRRVKDAGELARIARAAAIADEALARVRPALAEGLREADIALELDAMMRRLGATGPSFETIVAAGPNGAKPHHRPGPRTVGRDEPVVIDFGASVDGYASDMTRTVWVDGVADADLRRAVEVVLDSQAQGVRAVTAGVGAADVDRACRDVIAGAGWAEQFVHGTGHGVGLDIHEAPSVGSTSTDTLLSGHVVTVEPGVYLPGLGGVRIEDTVVVTEHGCKTLTLTPKDHC
jgi:Xaa-Pro aminopeptidase